MYKCGRVVLFRTLVYFAIYYFFIFIFFSCTMHYTFQRLLLHVRSISHFLFNQSQLIARGVNQMSHIFFEAQ